MRNLSILVLCAALPAAAAAAPAPPAFSYTPDTELLHSRGGAEREYVRLKRSVKRYCNAHTGQDVRRARTTARCAGRVLDAASAQMPTQLLALYEAEGGRAAAISVARLDL